MTQSKSIVFINEKGGIGKTSACFNLGWELSNMGKKVLMIDMDGQEANLTFFCDAPKENIFTMLDILDKKSDVCIKDAIVPIKENLDLIPANVDVVDIGEASTKDVLSQLRLMKKSILQMKEIYDYVFIDVSPTPNWSHGLALSCVDHAIVIMLPDITSLQASNGVIDSINEVKEDSNPTLSVLGLLLNMSEGRTNLAKEVTALSDELAENLRTTVFNQKLKRLVAFQECVYAHTGVTDYAPKSEAALEIKSLAIEVEDRA